MHDWIKKNWGIGNKCEKCGKSGRTDWANVSGKYKRSKRSDWLMLCRKCHIIMDMTEEKKKNQSISAKKRCENPAERVRLAAIASAQWTPEKRELYKNRSVVRNGKGQFVRSRKK